MDRTNQSSRKIPIGSQAPDFCLESQSGEAVRLSDFRGVKRVVLFFYPKDFSRGCTLEARSFEENYEALRDLDVEVLGISSDDVDSHHDFSTACHLSFRILSDRGSKVRKSFGLGSTFGLIPERATYVIDKQGNVAYFFSSQINPSLHATRALEFVRSTHIQTPIDDAETSVCDAENTPSYK